MTERELYRYVDSYDYYSFIDEDDQEIVYEDEGDHRGRESHG